MTTCKTSHQGKDSCFTPDGKWEEFDMTKEQLEKHVAQRELEGKSGIFKLKIDNGDDAHTFLNRLKEDPEWTLEQSEDGKTVRCVHQSERSESESDFQEYLTQQFRNNPKLYRASVAMAKKQRNERIGRLNDAIKEKNTRNKKPEKKKKKKSNQVTIAQFVKNDIAQQARRHADKAKKAMSRLRDEAREARRITVEDAKRVDPHAAAKKLALQREWAERAYEVFNEHNGLASKVRVMSPLKKRRKR
jgi:hypothetical protein